MQQGDLWGPLLFSLALQPLAAELRSDSLELAVHFLDDGVLALRLAQTRSSAIGLELNLDKCELVVLGGPNTQLFWSHFPSSRGRSQESCYIGCVGGVLRSYFQVEHGIPRDLASDYASRGQMPRRDVRTPSKNSHQGVEFGSLAYGTRLRCGISLGGRFHLCSKRPGLLERASGEAGPELHCKGRQAYVRAQSRRCACARRPRRVCHHQHRQGKDNREEPRGGEKRRKNWQVYRRQLLLRIRMSHNSRTRSTRKKWGIFARGAPGACPEPCKNGRVHACQYCLGKHTNANCTSPQASQHRDKGGKQGSGKGK